MNNPKHLRPKYASKYGPGGLNCACCGPGPNERKAHNRTIKRSIRHKVREIIRRGETP